MAFMLRLDMKKQQRTKAKFNIRFGADRARYVYVHRGLGKVVGGHKPLYIKV